MYQLPNMKEFISMEHIKTHEFSFHLSLNPFSIIPIGPDVISYL
jgi:putative glutathione S-transferase